MNNSRHYTAAISAFLIWGFFSIPLRALQGYAPGEILYFRIVFSLVVLLVIVLGFKKVEMRKDWNTLRVLDRSSRRNVVLLTLAGGMLLTINWLTFIHIVNHINIKTASFSYLVCPVITAVLGYFLLKERMDLFQWIAVALCAFSCALIGISSWVELSFSVLTAFTYALYLITQRKNQGFDRRVILCIQVAFSLIVLSFFASSLVTEIPAENKFYAIIFVIAVLFTVFPLFLNLFALNRINSATIGILMYINPLINFTLAFVLFDENMNRLQVVGYIIIGLALILFNYQNFLKLKSSRSS
jgi:chloramphenicol-sensitive protein RarD